MTNPQALLSLIAALRARRRAAGLVLVACLAWAVPGTGAAGGAQDDKAAEIMAAYLYNFAKFVEWPASAFGGPASPLVLCTPDRGALNGHLREIDGREAQGRRVVVSPVDGPDGIAGCHVLFLPRRDAEHAAAWLAAAGRQPLLTVSDDPGFATHGGGIALFLDADRVVFAIDRNVAGVAGLRISSRLLALALARPSAGGAP